jgi:hypothetical protein
MSLFIGFVKPSYETHSLTLHLLPDGDRRQFLYWLRHDEPGIGFRKEAVCRG